MARLSGCPPQVKVLVSYEVVSMTLMVALFVLVTYILEPSRVATMYLGVFCEVTMVSMTS